MDPISAFAKNPGALACYALTAKNGLSQLFLFCALNNAIGAFKGAANGGVFDAIVVDTFRYIYQ